MASSCTRCIFTERLPEVAAPWARRTNRLTEALRAIALALGGAAGMRLCKRLGYSLSRNSLLRLIYMLPLPVVTTPKTLGVDDFAFCRGQNYGTLLVDLDQHQPIALLPDREAETLANWLEQHPGIEVLSRDRSKAYKQGMSKGAPDAIQVADRFHLLKNLAEILDSFFTTQTAVLKAVDRDQQRQLRQQTPVHPTSPTRPQQQAQQRRAHRLEQYERVHSLRQQGVTVRDIAHHLGIGRRTVFRYLASPQFPERKPRPRYLGYSCLDPYKPYLVEQWTGKRGQAKQLFTQIQQQGYPGSYLTVARYTHRLRQEQRQQLNEGHGRGHAPGMNQPQSSPLTARRATRLVLQRPEEQKNEEEPLVTQLKGQHADIEAAITLARGFAHLVRQRQPDLLDPWLEQAANSPLLRGRP